MDDFKPFIQLSRARIDAKLRDLNQGKSGQLYLFFLTRMNSEGLVKASYEFIMAATGLGASAVSSNAAHLDAVGLVKKLTPDPNDGVMRYRVNLEYARFPATPETEVRGSSTLKTRVGPTLETKEDIKEVVVVVSDLPDLDSGLIIDLDTESTELLPQTLTSTPETRVACSASTPETKDVFDLYSQEHFGEVTPTVRRILQGHIDTYGESEVQEAITISVINNALSLAHIEGVLRRRAGLPSRRAETYNGQMPY